jgi:hypothetical protein
VVNNTQLKYTAKNRNKKGDMNENLYDIKIEFKNFNGRQRAFLFTSLAHGFGSSPLKDEHDIFQELENCVHKSQMKLSENF